MKNDIVRASQLADQLRWSILETHRHGGGGHLGSSLSIVDILAALFTDSFRWPGEATEDRIRGDRFVLSKGHAALALYCLLNLTGHIEQTRLATFGSNGSPLEPHPNEMLESAVHASTGSLGQGLSIGIGLALGSRLDDMADERTFVLIGDGEINEGQIWEAARVAAALRLSNLIVILDDNGMQQDGKTDDILPVRDVGACWSAMGWDYTQCDGHDVGQVGAAFATPRSSSAGAPHLIHASTVKGRGVGFLEGRTFSHFPPPLSAEELALVGYSIGRKS